VRDNGTVEDLLNFDTVQETLERRLADAYPRIAYTTRVLTEEDRHYLCVIVPGSPERQHLRRASVRTSRVADGERFCPAIRAPHR
jgi:hypothetical protein